VKEEKLGGVNGGGKWGEAEIRLISRLVWSLWTLSENNLAKDWYKRHSVIRGYSRQRRAMKKYIDIFPKLTRISRAGWNERRVKGSFSFDDGSMIMVSSRVQVFKIFKWMSMRPDTFKMTFNLSFYSLSILRITRFSAEL